MIKFHPPNDPDTMFEFPCLGVKQRGRWVVSLPKLRPPELYDIADRLADPEILGKDRELPFEVLLDIAGCHEIMTGAILLNFNGIAIRDSPFGLLASGRYKFQVEDDDPAVYPAYTILASEPEYMTVVGDERAAQMVEYHEAADVHDLFGEPHCKPDDDNEYLEKFISTMTRESDGRVQIRLPRNANFRGSLTTNFHVGEARFKRTMEFILRGSPEATQYVNAVNELLDNFTEPIDYEAVVAGGGTVL